MRDEKERILDILEGGFIPVYFIYTIPEPAAILLFGLGGMLLRKRTA
jgi:hypothetical protein